MLKKQAPSIGNKGNARETVPCAHLYGDGLRTYTVPGLVLSERSYEPGFKTPTHIHDRSLLCFVLHGGYTETYGPKTRTCEASTFLYHASHEPHTEHFHRSGARSFIVEIEPWWLDRVRDQAEILTHSADFKGGALTMLGTRLHQEFLRQDEVSPLIVEGLVLTIMGETSRQGTRRSTMQPPRWLRRTRDLLHDRFSEQLTLSEIAATAGVHPVHLAQMFQKHYKCSVGGYLRSLRLEFARQQLVDSDLPLSEIAIIAGFSDQSHFTRSFKRYSGLPPSRYRESQFKS